MFLGHCKEHKFYTENLDTPVTWQKVIVVQYGSNFRLSKLDEDSVIWLKALKQASEWRVGIFLNLINSDQTNSQLLFPGSWHEFIFQHEA